MATPLKGWDSYVQDAKREPLVLTIDDDETLTIHQPTFKQLQTVNNAMRTGNVVGQLAALVGEENARRLEPLFRDAPIGALLALTKDIAKAFDLDFTQGERPASSS